MGVLPYPGLSELPGAVGLLRTWAIVGVAGANVPGGAYRRLDRLVDGREPRSSREDRWDTGRLRKANTGFSLHLKPASLARVLQALPAANEAKSPAMWHALMGRDVVRIAGLDPEEPTTGLGGLAFWLIHRNEPGAPRRREGRFLLAPPPENQLMALAALGTFDGVAAIWFALEAAVYLNHPSDALQVASYLPPALATVYSTPWGKRVARTMFARFRQLMLDRVHVGGERLALANYDLAQAASEIEGWEPGPGNLDLRNAHWPTKVNAAAMQWIESHLPAREAASTNCPIWGHGLSPASQFAREDREEEARRGQSSKGRGPAQRKEKARKLLRDWLGEYWGDAGH